MQRRNMYDFSIRQSEQQMYTNIENRALRSIPMMPPHLRQLKRINKDPHIHNINHLLEIDFSIEYKAAEEALSVVIHRHDALRLNFTEDETGWKAILRENFVSVPFYCIDLSNIEI